MFVALPEPFPAILSRPGMLDDGKPLPDGEYDRSVVFGKSDSPAAMLGQFLPQADERFVSVVVKGAAVVGVNMAGDKVPDPSADATRVTAPAAPDGKVLTRRDPEWWTPDRKAEHAARVAAGRSKQAS